MTETIDGEAGDLTELVVAAGRTITVANPFRFTKTNVATPQGTVAVQYVKIDVPGGKIDFGPGEICFLPHDEAARLIHLGYATRPGEEMNTRPIEKGSMIDVQHGHDAPPGRVSTVVR